jgi:hypothetical protein
MVKILALVFGMVAGADTIDGMDRLRHGAMGRAFAGIRAPSTLGSFLRVFTHGHVQQLAAVCRKVLPALTSHALLLPGADAIAYVDVDDICRMPDTTRTRRPSTPRCLHDVSPMTIS